MSPFQPTVVRGFSKYTRMKMHRFSLSFSRSSTSRVAYSRAATGSWIEHGPTTTSNRSSSPCTMRVAASRALAMTVEISSVSGSSSMRIAGGIKGRSCAMRKSSVT